MDTRHAESDTKYIPPTEAQCAAAARWVSGFAERWAPLDAERLRDLMHPDTRNLVPPMGEPANGEGVVAHFKQVQTQLPGLRLDVVRYALCGDAVFVEWVATAKAGPRTLSWHGIDRVRLRGDRTYEGEAFWDTRRVAELFQAAMSGAR